MEKVPVEHPVRTPAAADSLGQPVVRLRGVTKRYEASGNTAVVAARDLNLDVAAGEYVVITGRSGSGKTTLLNLAAGLTRPTAGRVLVDGADLWELTDDGRAQLRSRALGFVFQFPSLLPALTAVENVALPTLFGPKDGRADARARAEALLAQVGLADKGHAYPRQLSAGQQKRVVIARALINRPRIVLADEPTGDLDEHTEREFMALLGELHLATHLTVLLVTHNRDLVPYATRHLEMADGAVVADARRRVIAAGQACEYTVADGA